MSDPSSARFGDARPYQRAALTLAQTGHYPLRTDPYYFRAPGYPAFLALVTLGRPQRVLVAKIANAVLGSVVALVLATLSARLFRRRGLAVATGIAAAVFPSFLLVSSEVQSEPLFLLLLATAGLFLLVCADRPSTNAGVLAGLLLGLAALTRPSAIAVAPLLGAPLVDRRWPIRARAHLAASALLGFFLSVAPWTLRNALVYHDFVPISDVGGVLFRHGNSPQMLRFFQVRSRRGYEDWARDSDAIMRTEIEDLKATGVTSPGAINRALVRRTFSDGAAHPSLITRLLLHKSWDWLRPYPNPAYWPAAVVIGIGLLYAVFGLLAARGLLVAPRRGVSVFLLAFLGASMAVHVLTVVSWRYRIAYWDPVLLLYAPLGAPRFLADQFRSASRTR